MVLTIKVALMLLHFFQTSQKILEGDKLINTEFFSCFDRLELMVSEAHMEAFRQQLQSQQKRAIIEKQQQLHSYTESSCTQCRENRRQPAPNYR